ncbi:MAG: HypC/HybG/HupF family hydrogenase formation chaperone [Terriglobia bacterium]|jgi:hydrogenase expression/formation protein HypC
MCLAIPGKVLSKEDRAGMLIGRVDFGGITREVQLDFVPEAEVGDYVIVHVGFALSRLDAEEAARTLELLKEMGALEESEVRSPESEVPGSKIEN